jgi:hypothetical protein
MRKEEAMRRVVAAGRIPNQVEQEQSRTDHAFYDAVEQGIFSSDVNADNYVGEWMYMYTGADGVNAFKNIISRRYIYIHPKG